MSAFPVVTLATLSLKPEYNSTYILLLNVKITNNTMFPPQARRRGLITANIINIIPTAIDLLQELIKYPAKIQRHSFFLYYRSMIDRTVVNHRSGGIRPNSS